MYDWTAQFSQQRKDYVKRTIERLGAMDELLGQIAHNPQELKPLRDVAQHFHQLAGSSAIYELDQLGKNAAEGERVCLAILRNGSIQKPEWKTLKDMVESMKFSCSQHPEVQGDPRLAAKMAQHEANQQALQQPMPTPTGQAVAPLKAEPPQSAQQGQPAASGWSTASQSASGWDLQRSSGGWLTGSSPFGAASYEKPKDIVIVDGDQGNMMALSRAFEMAGMQVRGYRTTDGAKKAIQDRLPDGMIVSIPLIDGPGYDVAHHLRSLPDGHEPPIVILSRQLGFLDKVMAIRCGADTFFNEITDASVIVSKFQSLFERDKANQYTILSVEDDTNQADFIKKVLDSVGYRVHVVNDPSHFEEALLAVNPDLILLDVMLGPVSGFELARYVRSDDRFAATPIIFLTTQNQLNAHVESARVGGDEHLIKPVAPQLLIAAVAGRLERYRVVKRLIGRDSLTQFLTLGAFMEAAEKLLSKRYQGSGSLVLLLVNIDHMEAINDKYGYAAGDRVIASLAKMLKTKLRNGEIFARLGGDEMAVVIDGIDDRDLATIATEIVNEFQELQHTTNGKPFNATISAGAAALELDMNLKNWLSHAQLALKSAKSNGRNRVMKAKSRQRI